MNGNNVNLEQLKTTWEKIKWKKCTLTPEQENTFWEKMNPMIKCGLSSEELKAILDHKYFMGTRLGREAATEEAIVDFTLYFMPHTDEEKKKLEQLKPIWEKIKRKKCTLNPEEEKTFWEQIKPMKKDDLSPAELKAILDHKYFMGKNLGYEVKMPDAVIDFVLNYWETWLKEKNQQANLEQINQIKILAGEIAKRGGCEHGAKPPDDVAQKALAEAIEVWHRDHAKPWRDYWESLDHNNIKKLAVDVENPSGLHMRPAGELVKIAEKFKCVIYIHKPGMEHYSIKVDGKPYLNVQTVFMILPLMSLAITKGDVIEFIAYGEQAEEALKAIEQLVKQHLGPK
jgi:phosphocarrier protein HPr